MQLKELLIAGLAAVWLGPVHAGDITVVETFAELEALVDVTYTNDTAAALGMIRDTPVISLRVGV
jgi:hypothetical protein